MFLPNPDSINWAQKAHDEGWLTVDTETTGGSKEDEVIDIGIVVAGTGEVLFDSLLQPMVRVHPRAYEVHGIAERQLITAPRLGDVFEELFNILDGATIIAYNASFDERLMRQTFEKHQLPTPDMTFVCAMHEYKRYTYRPKVTSLTTACAELNAAPGTHRALTDALAANRVVYRMAQSYIPTFK